MKIETVLVGVSVVLAICSFNEYQSIQANKKELTTVQSKVKSTNYQLSVARDSQISLSEAKAKQDKKLAEAKNQVKDTMQIVVGSDPRQFNSSLSGRATSNVISSFKTMLTPSVSTSDADYQNVVYVGLNVEKYSSNLNFIVVAKSDVQNNVYIIKYNSDTKLIENEEKISMKGDFNAIS